MISAKYLKMKWRQEGKHSQRKPIVKPLPIIVKDDDDLKSLVSHLKHDKTILINIDDIRKKATQAIKNLTQQLQIPQIVIN